MIWGVKHPIFGNIHVFMSLWMWQSGSCCHIVLPPFIIPVLNFPQKKIGKQYLHRPTFPHIWWFPEMVVPNNHRVFLLKMIILGCFWGYHHLRKHPFCVGKKKTTSCEVGQPTNFGSPPPWESQTPLFQSLQFHQNDAVVPYYRHQLHKIWAVDW